MQKKSTFVKRLIIIVLSLFSLNINAQEKPNIIIVLTDDAGYADWGFQNVLGVKGSELIETPNIDKLKAEGTYFSQAYVTNSVCGPSRAGLITGRYQNRFGYETNPSKFIAPGKSHSDVGLDTNEVTIANYLKQQDYTTAAIGKWHLGDMDYHHPNNRGFDYFYGLLSGSRPYFHTNDLEPDKKLMRNKEVDDLTEGYMTDVLTSDALNWMKKQADSNKPFFTYLSYTAVHGPYQSKKEDFERYNNSKGIKGEPCDEKRQNYAAMTYSLDYNVGKLVDSLKAWNVFENTLIFFLNDNGGKGPGKISNNRPLRGGKSDPYEGGLRVPMFMIWKGQVPENVIYSKQVISLDLAATIIKAAGGKLPKKNKLDGVDLLPVVNKTTLTAHEYLFWRKFQNYAVAKKGNHKIIIHYKKFGNADNDTAYYVLNNNGAGEKKNLYKGNRTTITNDLIHKYNEWESEMINPYWMGATLVKKNCGKTTSNYLNCDAVKSFYGLSSSDKKIQIDKETKGHNKKVSGKKKKKNNVN
ncbi:MAG: sulfatase-like hydrolase/transferase [Bacteroidota bacterium]